MIKVGKVGMVTIDKVIVEDRARTELGDLSGLEENMKESGLISPLAVLDLKDGTYRLLAGERRFTVLKKNEIVEIPVRIFDESLSDLEMKIIEKAENFFRKDFEWFELDKLTAEIHELQQQLHGVKARGPGDGWGARDTAEMIGAKSHATVVESLKRAKAVEAFPELFADCKTASDASKLLKKLDEVAVKQAIAQKLECSKVNTTTHDLAKRFILKDFFEGVKEIPDGIIHLVEIDPPYAIDLTKQKKKDGISQYQLDDYNEINKDEYRKFLSNLLKECYRVMADHSWLIIWFAPDPWFETVYSELIQAGFGTSRMCGIWTKGTPGQNMNPAIRLSNSYEMFFYAWKGSPALNKAGHGNEFRYPPVPPAKKIHPTERPIELMQELYETFAFAGSRALIPFLGSGNGIIAAHNCGLDAVGFELSKGYRDSFLVRVNDMK